MQVFIPEYFLMLFTISVIFLYETVSVQRLFSQHCHTGAKAPDHQYSQIVNTDGLVLLHQGLSSYSDDYASMCIPVFKS